MFLLLLSLVGLALPSLNAASRAHVYQEAEEVRSDVRIIPVSLESGAAPTDEDGFASIAPGQNEEQQWEDETASVISDLDNELPNNSDILAHIEPLINTIESNPAEQSPLNASHLASFRQRLLAKDYPHALNEFNGIKVSDSLPAQCAYYEVLGFLYFASKQYEKAADTYVQCAKLSKNSKVKEVSLKELRFTRQACRAFLMGAIKAHKEKKFSDQQVLCHKAAILGIVFPPKFQAHLFMLTAQAVRLYSRHASHQTSIYRDLNGSLIPLAETYAACAQKCLKLAESIAKEIDYRNTAGSVASGLDVARKKCLQIAASQYYLAACFYRDAGSLKEAGLSFALAADYTHKKSIKEDCINRASIIFKNQLDLCANAGDTEGKIAWLKRLIKLNLPQSQAFTAELNACYQQKSERLLKKGERLLNEIVEKNKNFKQMDKSPEKEKIRTELMEKCEQTIEIFKKLSNNTLLGIAYKNAAVIENTERKKIEFCEKAINAYTEAGNKSEADKVREFLEKIQMRPVRQPLPQTTVLDETERNALIETGRGHLQRIVSEAPELKKTMPGPLREEKRKELVDSCTKALSLFKQAKENYYAALACKHAMSLETNPDQKEAFGNQAVSFFRQAGNNTEADRIQGMVEEIKRKTAQGPAEAPSLSTAGTKLESLPTAPFEGHASGQQSLPPVARHSSSDTSWQPDSSGSTDSTPKAVAQNAAITASQALDIQPKRFGALASLPQGHEQSFLSVGPNSSSSTASTLDRQPRRFGALTPMAWRAPTVPHSEF